VHQVGDQSRFFSLGFQLKLRKVTTSLVMSVYLFICPSAWNYSALTGRIFRQSEIWRFFRKYVEKMQVWL